MSKLNSNNNIHEKIKDFQTLILIVIALFYV